VAPTSLQTKVCLRCCELPTQHQHQRSHLSRYQRLGPGQAGVAVVVMVTVEMKRTMDGLELALYRSAAAPCFEVL